jgi:hypothetical protein
MSDTPQQIEEKKLKRIVNNYFTVSTIKHSLTGPFLTPRCNYWVDISERGFEAWQLESLEQDLEVGGFRLYYIKFSTNSLILMIEVK